MSSDHLLPVKQSPVAMGSKPTILLSDLAHMAPHSNGDPAGQRLNMTQGDGSICSSYYVPSTLVQLKLYTQDCCDHPNTSINIYNIIIVIFIIYMIYRYSA